MDMFPSEYIKLSYFCPKSAKKIMLCVENVQKTEDFFFIKPIFNIIYELCQHLGKALEGSRIGNLQFHK